MPNDAESWYEPNPDPSSLYQGDVLEGVPVVLVPPPNKGPWVLLRPPSRSPLTVEQALHGTLPQHLQLFAEGSTQQSLPDAWKLGTELVLAKATKSRVMVMSQTCDLDNRTWIQVAPVCGAGHFAAKKLASLQANDVTYMFYLPEKPPLLPEQSYADLSQITTVHKSYLREGNRILQLRPATTARLQAHLADFYGRPFGFNTLDTVPQDATYLCVNCFFSLATVQRLDLAKNSAFADCPVCGAAAIWVKFR